MNDGVYDVSQKASGFDAGFAGDNQYGCNNIGEQSHCQPVG